MENHVMSLPEESIYLKAKQSKDDEWVFCKKESRNNNVNSDLE